MLFTDKIKARKKNNNKVSQRFFRRTVKQKERRY